MCSLSRCVSAAVVLAAAASAQIPTPPANGPRHVDPAWHAIVGARAVVEPGRVVENATIVVRDGRIVTVEAGAAPPAGARVWPVDGARVYAAFVEPHLPVETPARSATSPTDHWHPLVGPDRSALDGDGPADDVVAELRGLGFGAAAIAPRAGIFRGRAAVVQLDEPPTGARRGVVRDAVYGSVGFDRAFGENPSSSMGAIAVVRQTLCDAAAFASGAITAPAALAAIARPTATLFDAGDELEALAVARIAGEFAPHVGRAIVLGSGLEFRRVDALRVAALPILVPAAFPDAPDVGTLAAREQVTLRDMLTWELAPSNAARLRAAGLDVAWTTSRLSKRGDFHRNLRKAILAGLSRDDALAMLTTAPARLLGLGSELGDIAAGKLANLLVVDGDVFDEDSVRREIWIAGRRHELDDAQDPELPGTWDVTIGLGALSVDTLVFRGHDSLEVRAGDKQVRARRLATRDRQVEFVFDATPLGGSGVATVHAVRRGGRLIGSVAAAGGTRAAFTGRRAAGEATAENVTAEDVTAENVTAGNVAAGEATAGAVTAAEATAGEARAGDATAQQTPAARAAAAADAHATREAADPEPLRALPTPLGAYGRVGAPRAPGRLRVQNVTLWTSGPAGIVDDGVLLVADGKVLFAGPASDAPADFTPDHTIDGGGRLHATPGLIDCHSHTGIRGGVNEGSEAVTSEVRVADVLDPDDIGWYRELAGGLTAVNQLHGSANPIGGQNSVVKLRWGVRDPEAMKLAGAPAGIKFALGENVKQSRARESTRYPRTRMGVETILRDRFTAAREYALARRDAIAAGNAAAVRRDLELEALAEILAGERLVHCHSYRQDEILMLCRVARDFGFRIGTFQHGLECYKVAEAVREISLGASIFTDWWAYKFEVFDAIPENAAILHGVGVTVSLNSDSNELARRLNTEAAKAVKYGGVPRAEALAMVTRNPALQLGIADRVGSLEPGKDADFALWSGDPLSGFSRCVATWIDGTEYWAEQSDREAVAAVRVERERLLQKLLALDPSEPRARGGERESLDNKPGECGCESLEVTR